MTHGLTLRAMGHPLTDKYERLTSTGPQRVTKGKPQVHITLVIINETVVNKHNEKFRAEFRLY